ncbi:MAG: protein kinase [Verrucomicrobiales bacterium]|nr:protein kinase [Verrucomicrobiales bacterium]
MSAQFKDDVTPYPQPSTGSDPCGFAKSESGHFLWDPPPAEEWGNLLPGYEFLRLLGRGGMGAVYLARQISLERLVAVKFLPPVAVVDDPTYIDRFRNEAKALAQLNHPGIIQVYDFGESAQGLLFFVMEYVEGHDLHEQLSGIDGAGPRCLSLPEAVALLTQVCEALHFAHQQGIVHRDIKPANLLITEGKRVKIADFGLAKRQIPGDDNGTQTQTVLGTPNYSAPEIFIWGAKSDHRADIFALGATFYEMITGRLPKGSLESATSLNSEVDPRVNQLVSKAMRPDPEDRFQSALEFAGALQDLLVSPEQDRRKRSKHRRALVLTAAAALLVCVLGAMFWRTMKTSENERFAGDLRRETLSASSSPSSDSDSVSAPTADAVVAPVDPGKTPNLPADPSIGVTAGTAATAIPPDRPESSLPPLPSAEKPPLPGNSESPLSTAPVSAGGTAMNSPSPVLPSAQPSAQPPSVPKVATSLPPAPAPSSGVVPGKAPVKIPVELISIHTEFLRLIKERSSHPANTATTQLSAGYRTALERELSEKRSSQPGSREITFYEKELGLLARKETLPQETATTPPDLARLRSIYRGRLNAIEEQRTASLLELLTPHIGNLIQLEQALTKAGRGDEAAAVKAHREKLGTDPLASPLAVPLAVPLAKP